jgi:hypothetical protein
MDLPVGARTHPPNRPGSFAMSFAEKPLNALLFFNILRSSRCCFALAKFVNQPTRIPCRKKQNQGDAQN